MAPEQARGKPVDKRADIWAFGCVLYEMVTGARPFRGDDVTDTIASVVKDQPDFSRVPPPVARLIRRCLEKDPKRRLRDVGDAWDLLEQPPTQGAARPAAYGRDSCGLGPSRWPQPRELPPCGSSRRDAIVNPAVNRFAHALGESSESRDTSRHLARWPPDCLHGQRPDLPSRPRRSGGETRSGHGHRSGSRRRRSFHPMASRSRSSRRAGS